MVYICVKKNGNKRYYYLRTSTRQGKKIISRNIYNLGNNPSKINLNELKNLCPKKIKNSEKTIKKFLEKNRYIEKAENQKIKENKYFSRKQLIQINSILIHFREKYKKSNDAVKRKILEKFYTEFITENLSMETQSHSKKETQISLNKINSFKQRLSIKIYRIINTKEILDFLEKEKPALNEKLILKIGAMISENLYHMKNYRNSEIKKVGKYLKPSEHKKIKADIKELLSWFYREKNKIHPLALACLFHHKFEKIHPFGGWNGEIGRILMNYILSLSDYPPCIIPVRSKQEYHNCMNRAYPALKDNLLNSNSKYYRPLMDFMQRQFVKTYWENFVI